MERFAGPNRAAARLGYRADAIVGTTMPPMELVTELALVSSWAAGAWMMARDQITNGLLMNFAGSWGRFFGPVEGIVGLA